ncbi:RagB/SusD family nutrient uptake outer membrane protein [Dyadobacter sp. CY326]|uniref:RagB/SusD family nutrient uptake outer membrane protein n=1 Tax=Dyadobacter sp. CY326 TaxID=2907300 RepID=UPI001F346F92|nr:RagB/SusD family nutrient uptake outer membrane protein [Dyadobacter sp. CY326]MCE7065172.1 RagB/SusD family nutrient uptake outer membrane protein [Dyadobacter sp. CY326]
MKIRYSLLISIIALGLTLDSCKKDLDIGAQGALSEEQLNTRAGIDALLHGAYAALDAQQHDNQNLSGTSSWEASPSNWVFGSVAGGEAHKGSDGSDQPAIDAIARFTADPSNSYFNSKWRSVYEGVNRTNTVIRVLAGVPSISDADRTQITAEARFLRGHYYFELKRMFGNVPWIDENVETNETSRVPNTEDIWPRIEADFQFAYENLPTTQPEVGRANKWAAGSYLARSYMYQREYQEAKRLFDVIIPQGVTSNGLKYALTRRFEDNFDAATENNSESVFVIQMAVHDGTNSIANGNQGDMLNFPYGDSPFRCCGFYQPSHDLVNSYRTTEAGLPYFTDYNAHAVKNDQGVPSNQPFTPDPGPLDPRLDWTVGRRGLPYHDWGYHPGARWIRSPGQTYAGPYSPKKNIYWQATQDIYADQSTWAPGTAINYNVIRFADVLLMAAEAEAQLGNFAQSQTYTNLVRARAADPVNILRKYKNDADPLAGFSTVAAANYKISVYPAGALAGMGKAGALNAIYFERKLELALEGQRFFDLVRWGIAEQTLNAYFAYEGRLTTDIRGARFTPNRSEYFPIPQRQIDLSNQAGQSVLTQNQGY